MAGIAASLKAEASLEILCVGPCNPTTRQSLNELNPETIIFDCTQPHPELDLELLREQPGLLLVGVDSSCNDVLVLTGQRNRIVSVSELAQLLLCKAAKPPVGKEMKGEDQGGTYGTTQ